MTYEEAVKVCSIIEWADGGCISCVTGMLESFMKDFPEVDWERAFLEGVKEGHYWKPTDVIARARETGTS